MSLIGSGRGRKEIAETMHLSVRTIDSHRARIMKKLRLRTVADRLDPLRLLEEIRVAQHHLAGLATGQPTHLTARHEGRLDGFLAGLATAWQHGEVRATHRRAPRPRRSRLRRLIPMRSWR